MKKLAALAILSLGLIFYIGCEVDTPAQPELSIPQNQLVLSKVIALGNSLTAGFQSAGMREDFQLKSYPYLIAQQIGKGVGFEQPLIASPGIGSTSGKAPLEIQGGNIVAPDLGGLDPRTLLKNSLLPRPYDNLGVPGATLGDMLASYDSKSSASGTNSFFDMILRNPNFGNTTQLQQAILLNPTLILLWIGNNDVLGAALNGGNTALITSQSDFQTRYTRLLTELRQKTHAAIVMANIPYVTDIPYVNTLDGIFRTIPALGINQPVPVVFDKTFQPVVFPGGLNLPLLTAETGVAHFTLPALSYYQTGMGIPNEATLTPMVGADLAAQLVAGMRANGLNPTGTPFPGNLTITVQEGDVIRDAVNGFNQVLQGLAVNFKVPLVDMNSALTTLNLSGMEGFSGKFVLLDPARTAFSLDAVHPSSAGYAIVANAFIETINNAFKLVIPKVNVHALSGQYSSASQEIALEAVEQVKAIF